MSNLLLFLAKNPCDDINVLKVVYVFKQVLSVVFIIVPIILIVLILIDIAKNVIAKNTDDMVKNRNLAIKRIIYAVAIFLVPSIVGIFMSVIGDMSANYKSCLEVTQESIVLKTEAAKSKCSGDNVEWNEGLNECVEKKKTTTADPNPSTPQGRGSLGRYVSNSNSGSDSSDNNGPGNTSVVYETSDSYKSALNTTDQHISAPFWDTKYHKDHAHKGMDIATPGGTKIIALGGGTAVESGYNAARGYYIRIDHGTYCTLYQHMQKFPLFHKGDTVKKGNIIGYVGNTGASQGNHLHLELWVPAGQGKPNWNAYNAKWNVADPAQFDFTKLPD